VTSRLSPDDEQVLMRGLAVQPLVAGILGAFVSVPPSQFAIAMGVVFAITAILITWCVAYPLVLWFVRSGRLTLANTLISGAVLGNIPAAIAALLTIFGGRSGPADLAKLWRPGAAGTVVGVVCAAAFWIQSGRRVQL